MLHTTDDVVLADRGMRVQRLLCRCGGLETQSRQAVQQLCGSKPSYHLIETLEVGGEGLIAAAAVNNHNNNNNNTIRKK